MFSIYVSLNQGNNSHIKFGGWDRSAVLGSADPKWVNTVAEDSFGIKFKNVLFNNRQIELDLTSQTVLFDPAVRFIHIPAT